jgi:quinol-cytochrome oxidoreductase complex cytochrome b subunit
MSVPLSLEKKPCKMTPFFPNLVYKDMIVWLLILGMAVTIAVLLPPEIGQKADPLAPAPENIKPEWYFLFLFQTLKLFPGIILGFNGETIAIVIITCAIMFFFLIPFFDKKSARGERSTLFAWIGVFYTVYFIAMTIIGFLT